MGRSDGTAKVCVSSKGRGFTARGIVSFDAREKREFTAGGELDIGGWYTRGLLLCSIIDCFVC